MQRRSPAGAGGRAHARCTMGAARPSYISFVVTSGASTESNANAAPPRKDASAGAPGTAAAAAGDASTSSISLSDQRQPMGSPAATSRSISGRTRTPTCTRWFSGGSGANPGDAGGVSVPLRFALPPRTTAGSGVALGAMSGSVLGVPRPVTDAPGRGSEGVRGFGGSCSRARLGVEASAGAGGDAGGTPCAGLGPSAAATVGVGRAGTEGWS